MLKKLVKFAKQGDYKSFEEIFDETDINLDDKIEGISFFDLLQNEEIRKIVLKGLFTYLSENLENRTRIIENLAELKTDLNYKENGTSFLHECAYRNCTDIAKLLIDSGADVNTENDDGDTPLSWSFDRNHIEVSQLLVDAKADVNIICDERHHCFLLHECETAEMAQLLINAKADLNVREKYGYTPLRMHVFNEEIDIVKVLIKAGAYVNAPDRSYETPLHNCHDVEITKLLLDAKADVNAKSNSGNTPLHECSDIEIAKLLIKAKADLFILNDDGKTPLDTYQKYKDVELLKFLLEEKASFELSPEMITCELFKGCTKSIVSCICNYENNPAIQKTINLMI